MDGAKDFIKNPLGIIGLFIVLVYAVATIVIGSAMDRAHGDWREPFTWFIVAFPVVMLFVFRDLVVNHHAKLYAPADFPNSADFILLARDKVREALTEYNGQGANGVRAPLATDQVKARLDESIRVLENLLTKTQRRQ
ncbi:MAG: hypothetical protein IPN62_18395 [Flavobacteriales bacterium]|nr:hypothetical protein [Flavobacteriales bacterium]